MRRICRGTARAQAVVLVEAGPVGSTARLYAGNKTTFWNFFGQTKLHG